MLYENQASYEPDMAEMIDKEWEILADEYGLTERQAKSIVAWRDKQSTTDNASVFAGIIGLLLAANNQRAMIYALAIAMGLDQLNGIRTQTEVANKLGCTRALISHYVIAARDALAGRDWHLDCTKFRKRNDTRETYRKNATSDYLETKRRVRAEYNQKTK